DIVVECSSHCGAAKTDSLIAVFLSSATANDVCDTTPTITNDAPDCFGLGETTVTFTARDDDNNANTCTAKVTVQDTTPPEIDVVLDRDVLWPPNHKYATVCAEVTVTDICDPDPTWVLFSTESNEPDNEKGDGNTTDDIAGDATGTADVCVDLRSERQGGGDGRKYTLIYEAMDMSGNVAYDTVCVRVPHDQSAAALASTGFSVDGSSLTGLTDKFAVVIKTTDELEASILDVNSVYLGNTRGVERPVETRVLDVDNDGRLDMALFYATEDLLGAGSPLLYGDDNSSLKNERGDGPIGVHFVSPSGVDYLVSDIFALGTPVEMPTVWMIFDPPLGAPEPDLTPKAKETALNSIHPNPFNPQTTVAYSLTGETRVRIAIYDVRGALVRLLVDESQAAGEHNALWNGVDDSGRPVTSGIYFVRMIAGSYKETRKIVMLK
ncbi:MAG TPA: FlgD immunoglobulin-like domain containing protein, partial [Candidatus Krumholzibacteria bacterium]|nr:FlgD immunoglobulin-like domain containing protein [Candidatus Krumholzibacteria bacterium]